MSKLSLGEIVALPAQEAAPLLLGMVIESRHEGKLVTAEIVEVEAYTEDDPASHTHRGRTKRNMAMFGPPGHAYVYFTYGMHYCLNIVCGPEGVGMGVLIRGVQVVEGRETAAERRYGAISLTPAQMKNLSNGPGKVVQALGVSMADYGQSLIDSDGLLKLLPGDAAPSGIIRQTPRIGISRAVDTPWRWLIERAD